MILIAGPYRSGTGSASELGSAVTLHRRAGTLPGTCSDRQTKFEAGQRSD